MPLPIVNYQDLPNEGNPYSRGVDQAFKDMMAQRISQAQLEKSRIENQYLPRDFESRITGQDLLNKQNQINNQYLPREKELGLRDKLANALKTEIDNSSLDARNRATLNLNNAQADALPITSKANLMRAMGYGAGSGRMTAKNADQYYTSHPEELNRMFDGGLALNDQQTAALRQAGIGSEGNSSGLPSTKQLPMTPGMQKMASKMQNTERQSESSSYAPGTIDEKLNYDLNKLSVPALNQLQASMQAENLAKSTKPQYTLASTALTFKKTLDKYEKDFLSSADKVAEYAGNPQKRIADLGAAYFYKIQGKEPPKEIAERIEADKKFNSYVEFLAEITGKMEGTSIARESKMDIKNMLAYGGMGLGTNKETSQKYVRATLDRVRNLIDERIEAGRPKWSQEDIDAVRGKMADKQGKGKGKEQIKAKEGYSIGPDGKLNLYMEGRDSNNQGSTLAEDPSQAFSQDDLANFSNSF